MPNAAAISSVGLLYGSQQIAAIGLLEVVTQTPHGGGGKSHKRRSLEDIFRSEDERIAEAQREAAEVLARLARANEPEPFEPVRIPIPKAVEPELVARVEPLAAVNFPPASRPRPARVLPTQAIEYDDLAAQAIALNMRRASDEDEALALIMILAESD
jgi:hypothetical protein